MWSHVGEKIISNVWFQSFMSVFEYWLKMSCKKLGKLGSAWWQKSRGTTPLSRYAKIQAFACGSLASGGFDSNVGKCCKNGPNSEPNPSTNGVSVPPSSSSPAHRHHVVGKKRGEESIGASGRSFSSTAPKIDPKIYLWARYNEMKRLVHGTWGKFVFCTLYIWKQ